MILVVLLVVILGFLAVLALIVWEGLKLSADFEQAMENGRQDLEGTPISSGPSSGGAHAALPSEAKACAPQHSDLPRLG